MYERFTLSNGVTVALDHMDGVRSASLGLWIRAGTRNEIPGEAGAAHFIEHMLFKGTKNLDSAQLAERMDDLGAEFNAYTSRESTSYYVRSLDRNLSSAAALLGDMFFNSTFNAADMDTERGVILDEMRMYEDMPDDVANEMLVRTCFPGALGKPVLGSRESIPAMGRETLLSFKGRVYVPGNIVLAAAGHFSDSGIKALLDELAALPAHPAPEPERAAYTPGIAVEQRKTEQNQLLLAFPGVTYAEERYVIGIMNTILGGSASSRLYRKLRDELGLCYDLESFDMTYADTGLFGIGAAMSAENEKPALEAITAELRRFLDDGPSPAELDRAKAQAESGAVLALESSLARMRALGNGELFLGGAPGIDELLERYAAVTREDVLALARRLIDFSRLSVAALGEVQSREEYEKLCAL